MQKKTKVEKFAIVKLTPDLRIIAVDEDTGKIITWGQVNESQVMDDALRTLGYQNVKTQA